METSTGAEKIKVLCLLRRKPINDFNILHALDTFYVKYLGDVEKLIG